MKKRVVSSKEHRSIKGSAGDGKKIIIEPFDGNPLGFNPLKIDRRRNRKKPKLDDQ